MLLQVACRHLTLILRDKAVALFKQGSTLSTTRKNEAAVKKAVEIIIRKEAKAAAKGNPQSLAPVVVKEPSANPFRKPEPVVKEKRVVRTVSKRDGWNLLRKIEAKGGRHIIVTMGNPERTSQEIAEGLMLKEAIVIASLDTYGNGKDRVERLFAAIEQASLYLTNEGRPVITGVRKLKRQEKARAEQEDIASKKRNPKIREFIAPTLEEVAPKRDDQQIVLEELKQYLGLNTNLQANVMSASTDDRARRVLKSSVGRGFNGRVRGLLAEPSQYDDLLAEAGVAIRREVRKYDTPNTGPAGPTPSIEETPEALARGRSQQDMLDKYNERMAARTKSAQLEVIDPEIAARDLHQLELLSRFSNRD